MAVAVGLQILVGQRVVDEAPLPASALTQTFSAGAERHCHTMSMTLAWTVTCNLQTSTGLIDVWANIVNDIDNDSVIDIVNNVLSMCSDMLSRAIPFWACRVCHSMVQAFHGHLPDRPRCQAAEFIANNIVFGLS